MASETRDLKRIRTGCSDKNMRDLLLGAISAGHRYKITRNNGVLLYGPHGTATTHLAGNDHRNTENFRSILRGIGITIEKRK